MKEVALLFICLDDNILLFKRSESEKNNGGQYGCLGGGIEDGESPLTAVKREIKEEAGIEIPSPKKLATYTPKNNLKLHVYYTTEFDQDNIVLNKKEHTSYKKFPMDKILEKCPSNVIDTIPQMAKDFMEKTKPLNEQINRMIGIMKSIN
jgi:8-oxo-dGTP pyrophosphatase MutT (NUDIX family)